VLRTIISAEHFLCKQQEGNEILQGRVYDASKIKVCQGCYAICEYAEFEKEWTDRLWADIISNGDIYEEFVYYIEHHTFMDRLKIGGYSLSDLYVFQMDKYNLISEVGKNPVTCNKERMVMKAFRMLADMKKEPERYVKWLEEGRGEDRL
jgi:hypothetical protein